jgi:hypothetical protein
LHAPLCVTENVAVAIWIVPDRAAVAVLVTVRYETVPLPTRVLKSDGISQVLDETGVQVHVAPVVTENELVDPVAPMVRDVGVTEYVQGGGAGGGGLLGKLNVFETPLTPAPPDPIATTRAS